MHLDTALIDITVILLAAVGAAVVSHKLNLPSSIGMLIAGVLIGPDILGLVRDVELIEVLSEIGVVLLLFIIGLEFSLADLKHLKRQFAIGGSVQFFGTAAVIAAASVFFGFTWQQSIFIGFVVALSSTAVVLKMMQDRAELATPHGRNIFATLIYQDIMVVPVMLLAPLLAVGGVAVKVAAGGAEVAASTMVATGGESVLVTIGILVLKIAGVAAFSYVAYRWLVPFILELITRTHSSEAFLLTIILLCFGIAVVTQSLGLSLALGAFVAGLIISESDYSHQAMTVMLPFRDIFMALFFVSIGLLLDVQYLLSNPVQVVAFTLGLIIVKPVVGTIAALAVGLPLGPSLMSGLALGQVGEFSLVATRTGVSTGLVPESVF